MSARDVADFAAGRAAAMTGQDKMDFMLTAGGFNLSENSKWGIVFRTSHWQNEAKKDWFSCIWRSRRIKFLSTIRL